jgi:GGDEF domain-containing protein
MGRPANPLRFIGGLLAPGGVLVLAAWALEQEPVVRRVAEPYAAYFCIGALATAVLLSWYYDQSRLLCSAAAVALTVLALGPLVTDSAAIKRAAVLLLPLNLGLFAVLKERGVMTFDGILKVGFVAAQAAGVLWIVDAGVSVPAAPWIVPFAFSIGAVALLTLAFSRRTKAEQGLFWTLVAMFLSLGPIGAGVSGTTPDALYVYSGTAGLVLVFAVLEHGYDIAYRDELTGLPGRRAFNSAVEQLGGTYAIAMCDVDRFKQFNDTYGHDAGDHVLRMVAAKLSEVGGGGRAFRYGGEEFLIVFKGKSAREAEPFAEALRKAIAAAGFVPRGPERPARKPRHLPAPNPANATRIPITISIGLAERSKRHSTAELVLDAADAALYHAKRAGRNCVTLEDSTQV